MRTLFKNTGILASGTGNASVCGRNASNAENRSGCFFRYIRSGFLGIDGDSIVYVDDKEPEDATGYDLIRDFTGKTLMPGFVNAHTHCPMTLLRGLGSDRPLHEWLFDYVFPAEDRLRPADVRAGTELALLEMLSTGTTSFTDMYYMVDETAEACVSAGIKANLTRPIQASSPDEKPEDSYRIKEAVDLFDRWHKGGDGLINIDFSIHAEYTCNEALVRYTSQLAAEKGANMHIHLSETRSEHENCLAKYGKTPAEWFRDLGTFNSPTSAAHCVWVTDSDIEIMSRHGVTAVHNPESNMKLGSGFARIEAMRAAGINVALGTDGAASNNNLNMFEELHTASVIHNGFTCDPTIMNPDYTIRMATRNGAVAQGRFNTGMIAPGYKADIIAIDMDKPHLFPNTEPLANICYSAQGSDVCMTMVNGKVLYENGEFKTLDWERIMREAAKSAEHMSI